MCQRYMIPNYNTDGILPAGIHMAEWSEIFSRFGYNQYRQDLLFGMQQGLFALQKCGCKTVYIDGSFCTSKIIPGDFDICYDDTNIDWELLEKVEPTLLQFENQRYAQKVKFKGEFFPFSAIAAKPRTTFIEFFQIDKHTGNPKGIVGLKL